MKKSIEDKLLEMLSKEISASIDREIMKGLIPSIRKEKIKKVIKKIKSSG